jgi:hypothetical protein
MPRFSTMTDKEIRAAERTLIRGTWAITFGALLYSVLTVTPLVKRVTPDPWDWTAPILPIVVDAAVIIVVQLDSVISRLGGKGGPWPAILRWMTGLMTLSLNIGDSALKRDWVGVAVHSVAPLLLIVTAEAGLAYRRAIAAARDRIAREEAEAAEKARAEKERAEEKAREEKERERAAQEEKEREARETAERLERERAEREEAARREEREHQLRLERERTAREAAEREARERREAAEREHKLRLERERAAREAEERRRREEAAQRERAEREAARARQEKEKAAAPRATAKLPAAPAGKPAGGKAARRQIVEKGEFAGMTYEDAEDALYTIYKKARDESVFPNWEDDPVFARGGELCGSRLGERLGRPAGSGRTHIKPRFEQRYERERAAEPVGVS